MAAVLAGDDEAPVGEFSLRRADGTVRHVDVVASCIAPENGEPRVVLNSRDVTERLLMNLAINARDAMPDGGRLIVRVENVRVDDRFAAEHPPQPPGEYVRLQVVDTGLGMDADTRERAFEPFFTTKADALGIGLGLSTVYGIVKQSGGYVWIDSAPGQGTTVSVYFPPTTAVPGDAEPPPAAPPGAVGRRTVLFVEDEDDVRELIQEMLAAQGYDVVAASHPAEALARASAVSGPIHLLLTDVVMPGGNGRDLASRLTAIRPETKVLYISGYPEDGTHLEWASVGVPLLFKPFTRDALLQRIRDLLT